MPRSRRSAAPAPRQQTRSSSTMAAPARSAPRQAPPAAAPTQAHPQSHAPPQQPGMFAQMASTAAGVAVGSAAGHTIANGISGLFGGGSAAAAQAPEQQQLQQATGYAQDQTGARPCDVDARNFTRCLDENSGNMQICEWYLQQLKSCQEAARQY